MKTLDNVHGDVYIMGMDSIAELLTPGRFVRLVRNNGKRAVRGKVDKIVRFDDAEGRGHFDPFVVILQTRRNEYVDLSEIADVHEWRPK